MMKSGSPQPLIRGDGRDIGYRFVEKVSLESAKLSTRGVGKVIIHDIQLVRSKREAGPADLAEMQSFVCGPSVYQYG